MKNCKFVNNTSKTDPNTIKGIIVANETYLDLKQCDFSKNILEGTNSHLMIMSKGEIIITDSTVSENVQVRSFCESFTDTNLRTTVSVAKSSFIRTNFSKKFCVCVVSVISKFNSTLGYVIFNQCIFKSNHMGSLTVKDILDTMIYDSYFDQNRNTQTYSCTEGIKSRKA